jgi:anti-sigma factor RsiW
LKCRDFAELATAYLEGDLSPRARLAARIHLWLCVACQHYLEQIRQTVRFLRSAPVPPASENEARIIAILEASKRD